MLQRGSAWRGWALAIAWVVASGTWSAATAANGTPKVKITAYINESSGCQEATIKYLKAFAAKHPRDVALEIVDFGSAAGAERWQADGYHCQAIVINGATQFRVGSGQAAHVTRFEMPEGVRWSFADMNTVLAQELRAPGTSAVSDEDLEKLARQAGVGWRKTVWSGKVSGEVIVGAQVVFRFNKGFGGKSAVQRAQAAAAVLKRLYQAGLRAEEIRARTRKVNGEAVGVIEARGQGVTVVTDTEADLMQRPPLQVAQVWALNLRDALRCAGR
ncbi:MAG: hypothetical protein GX774_21700 [Armatimonadetes bacterium]|nr:hypothetical protein [Armatimonadota bacterium]